MENHSKTYQEFQELLAKWRSGKITAIEQQQLNNIAKEDSFLAEAWDGYRLSSKVDHDDALAQLKQNIELKTGQKANKKERKVYFWVSRAAAIALLIGATSWFLWPTETRNNTMADLVKKEKTESAIQHEQPFEELIARAENDSDQSNEVKKANETDIIVEKISNEEAGENRNNSNLANTPSISADKKEVIPKFEASAKDIPINLNLDSSEAHLVDGNHNKNDEKILQGIEPPPEDLKKTVVDALVHQVDSGIKVSMIDIAKVDSGVVNLAKADVAERDLFKDNKTDEIDLPKLGAIDNSNLSMANAMSPAEANTTVFGIVKGRAGEPLIGANVYQVGHDINASTVTDTRGRFKLMVVDREMPLNVEYLGYKSQEISQDKVGKFVEVILDEDIANLSEIAITSKVKREQSVNTQNSTPSIMPSKGSKSFMKYLKRKIILPTGYDTLVNGLIKVSIRIDNKGNPLQVEVLESFNDDLNMEIERLILSGGKWETKPSKMGGRFIYSIDWK